MRKFIISTAAITYVLATVATAGAQEFTKISLGNPAAKNPLATLLPKKDWSERPKETAWICQTNINRCYIPVGFIGASCWCDSIWGPQGGVVIN